MGRLAILILLAFVLGACTNHRLVVHGSKTIEVTDDRPFLWSGITAVTECPSADAIANDGHCPSWATTKIVQHSAVGEEVLKGVVSAGTVLGASVILADGIRDSASTTNVNQSGGGATASSEAGATSSSGAAAINKPGYRR